MAETYPLQLNKIPPETPILGFTGALGSGCTFLAKRVAEYHDYRYLSLSQPIHDMADERGEEHSSTNLQDIGNQLRKDNGVDYLVKSVLRAADEKWPTDGGSSSPRGIVVDSIRNTGEAEALRQFPNFYLISVHAEEETRKARLIRQEGALFSSEEEFQEADSRDQAERYRYGQQVKRCNYLADIIVVNSETKSINAEEGLRDYVNAKLYRDYVSLIERLSRGMPVHEHRPSTSEALMTAAYCESRRSSCLKRRVGAVIARQNGDIIAAGHNEVPIGAPPCIESRYEWCARDVIQEAIGKKIKHCPECGKEVVFEGIACAACGEHISAFTKRCPNDECRQDPEIEYICPGCGTAVFDMYVLGNSSDSGRMLDMCRALHAEENALLSLGKTGLPAGEECTLYTTTFPCNLCANKIAAMGIAKVMYAEPYAMKEAKDILAAGGVETARFEGVKSQAYFRIYGV